MNKNKYIISSALLDNLINKKNLLKSNDEDNNIFSPIQIKTILEISYILNSLLDNEELKEYIHDLPNKIKDKEKRNNPARISIDVLELVKRIYGATQVGGWEIEAVIKEIENLAVNKYDFKLKYGENNTIINESLIILSNDFISLSKGQKTKIRNIEAITGDVFLFNLLNAGGYVWMPNDILERIRDANNNSELFYFFLLKFAKMISENKSNYKENANNILNKLVTNNYYTYVNNSKYTRFERLYSDIEKASEALQQVGIIKDFYFIDNATESKICNFVLNKGWIE